MNYFPPWWYPPQQPGNHRNNGRVSQKEIERAVRRALQLKDHDKNNKRKRREEMMKKAAASRARFFTSLEWFIIGILAYPIVGPLYQWAIHRVAQ